MTVCSNAQKFNSALDSTLNSKQLLISYSYVRKCVFFVDADNKENVTGARDKKRRGKDKADVTKTKRVRINFSPAQVYIGLAILIIGMNNVHLQQIVDVLKICFFFLKFVLNEQLKKTMKDYYF